MSNMANGEPYSGRIVISPKIIQEISKYPNALDSIREYVANAWDADADRLEITILPLYGFPVTVLLIVFHLRELEKT